MLVVVWDASESYPKVEGSFGWELQFGVVVRACRAGVGSSFRRNGVAGLVLFCDKVDLLIFWSNSILFSTCFGSMKKHQIAPCEPLFNTVLNKHRTYLRYVKKVASSYSIDCKQD